MTKQEVFNTVWNHFVVNRAPASIDEHGSCKYRGPNGTKCAVGLFIPDEAYGEYIEHSGVRELCRLLRRAGYTSALPHVSEYFLESLQAAHDDSGRFSGDFHGGIERSLRYIAEREHLEIPND